MSRLKEIREDLGISQSELSRRSGVRQAVISKYESGVPIGEDNLVRLVRALNTNADYFLGLIDNPKAKVE